MAGPPPVDSACTTLAARHDRDAVPPDCGRPSVSRRQARRKPCRRPAPRPRWWMIRQGAEPAPHPTLAALRRVRRARHLRTGV